MQLPNVTYNQPISPPSNAITSIYTLTFVFRAHLNDKHFSPKCQSYAFLNFVIVFFSLFLGCKSVYILVGMKQAHNAKEECFQDLQVWYGQLIAYLPWIERMHFTAKFCHGVIKAKVIAYAVIEFKRFKFRVLYNFVPTFISYQGNGSPC